MQHRRGNREITRLHSENVIDDDNNMQASSSPVLGSVMLIYNAPNVSCPLSWTEVARTQTSDTICTCLILMLCKTFGSFWIWHPKLYPRDLPRATFGSV